MNVARVSIFLLAYLGAPAASGVPMDQQAMQQALLRDAQHCADAVLKHNYADFADCTHPRSVLRHGGREKFTATAKAAVAEMTAQGFQKAGTRFEMPREIHDAGKFYYAPIHGRSIMRATVQGKRGRLEYDDNELGISEDQGRSWTLVSLDDSLFSYFPELAGKVQIPAFQKPIFTPD